ncbi:TetR/AcrR family transcriptional regulator [Rheinheimera sp. 1928-s]|uniref:TetR/AcrR family transcriptional regulator n=1 Tax=Rheinheimera sp. 1928-s TaxID=3033803 RepID=UPI0026258A79|nr:TetR/AcrR family transcriptional regulator [Rheinheimera sp. 1928-s]MDF3125952.1 TetR/AcrR family transcriptional regulator [Rheinheimera sp. 1928-s]
MSEIHTLFVSPASEGVRERKRRETRQRIAEVALRLFLTQGYDGTTLDVIAEEAGISRRTFFSYFKSKDDIILFGVEADWASMLGDLLKTSPDIAPINAIRDLMVRRIERHTTEQMQAIDNLMLSSESLLARKQSLYIKQEQLLFNALCEVWRQPERRPALRMLAMMSIGAMRIALQAWRESSDPNKTVSSFILDAFNCVRTEL